MINIEPFNLNFHLSNNNRYLYQLFDQVLKFYKENFQHSLLISYSIFIQAMTAKFRINYFILKIPIIIPPDTNYYYSVDNLTCKIICEASPSFVHCCLYRFASPIIIPFEKLWFNSESKIWSINLYVIQSTDFLMETALLKWVITLWFF